MGPEIGDIGLNVRIARVRTLDDASKLLNDIVGDADKKAKIAMLSFKELIDRLDAIKIYRQAKENLENLNKKVINTDFGEVPDSKELHELSEEFVLNEDKFNERIDKLAEEIGSLNLTERLDEVKTFEQVGILLDVIVVNAERGAEQLLSPARLESSTTRVATIEIYRQAQEDLKNLKLQVMRLDAYSNSAKPLMEIFKESEESKQMQDDIGDQFECFEDRISELKFKDLTTFKETSMRDLPRFLTSRRFLRALAVVLTILAVRTCDKDDPESSTNDTTNHSGDPQEQVTQETIQAEDGSKQE